MRALRFRAHAMQDIDLELGKPTTYHRDLALPGALNVAVIRPAAAPYAEGLFVKHCLPLAQADRLRRHPLLARLLPQATVLGGC